jgi:hypothetical protein
MTRTLPALAAMSLAAAALAAATLWLATEPGPRTLARPAASTGSALAQVRQLLARNGQRPRGDLVVLTATPAELQAVADQVARMAGGAARVRLGAGELAIQVSLPLSRLPGQRWLNVDLELRDGATLPQVGQLHIGRLWLPAPLAEPALALALRWWDPGADGAPPLHGMIRGAQWRPFQARIDLAWQADTAQLQRLHAYHDHLVQLTSAGPDAISLPALMAPLFLLAQQRSQAGGNAAAENRAALLTLALYASGRPIKALLPAARNWPALPQRQVLLNERIDFPQHFLVSAALAAEAGGPVADAIGLMKEVGDARFGSGFSFNDLAADLAGSRFGRQAVDAPEQLQAQLAGGFEAALVMPDLSDLPEFLPQAEFQARFGGVGGPAYEQLLGRIDARVAALGLYR